MFPGSGQPIWDKKTNILWSCPKYLNRSLVSILAWVSALGLPFSNSACLEATVISCFGGLAPCTVAGDFLLLLSLSCQANGCFIPSTAVLFPANKDCLWRERTEQSLHKYKWHITFSWSSHTELFPAIVLRILIKFFMKLLIICPMCK